jgi:hypothetical protein
VDVHSLRHTFATLLARNGVSPAVAQELMPNSGIRLGRSLYTHLDLAATASAVQALPAIRAARKSAKSRESRTWLEVIQVIDIGRGNGLIEWPLPRAAMIARGAIRVRGA